MFSSINDESNMAEWMTQQHEEQMKREARQRHAEEVVLHIADCYLSHRESTGCECRLVDFQNAMAEWRKAMKP